MVIWELGNSRTSASKDITNSLFCDDRELSKVQGAMLIVLTQKPGKNVEDEPEVDNTVDDTESTFETTVVKASSTEFDELAVAADEAANFKMLIEDRKSTTPSEEGVDVALTRAASTVAASSVFAIANTL